ncbi:organic cation transporter protein-like isoform X2 [Macrobrachium nipponense]|uniref:organic cation transporter protein-like isoform X2 n=1 Tax=Macrobrachium nipponense TaxID=159736 RepID=UPI0030C8B806
MPSSKFDELLARLGTGRWNYLCFLAVAYWNMHLVPHTLAGAFLAPKVDYTCHLPEEGYTITSTLVNEADGSRSNDTNHCEYFAKSTDNGGGFVTHPCKSWVYDNSTYTSTITSEFDLICPYNYLRATYQSMYMFGTFVGAPLNGILSDRYGRKTMLSIGTTLFALIAIGSSWIPDFSAILVSRFLLGLLHPVVIQTGYILAMEVCEPRHRSVVGIILALPWAIATMLWGGVAYFIRDWRWLQTAVSLSGILISPVLWFMDESPRWLIVEGKFERANKVLRRAARWNKVTLPPQEELNALMRTIQGESAFAKQQAVQDQQETSGCRQKSLYYIKRLFILFRTPKLRKITIIVYLKFLLVNLVFYGLALNAVNYSADPFVYMVLGGLAEVPAYTVTAPIVAAFGRRVPSILLYLLSGASIFAVSFISPNHRLNSPPRSRGSSDGIRFPGYEDMTLIPKDYVGPSVPPSLSWLVMTLAMVGKMCISAAFQLLYLYCTELFPTEVRLQALGSATIASRIGSMTSPFITELLGPLYPRAPSILFGISAFVAGIATIPLHETLGRPLPDTITELENPEIQEPEEPDEETEMSKLRA